MGKAVRVVSPLVLGSRYRLEDMLGAGGMSMVWRAYDEVLGRFVAVKVLSGKYAAQPAYRRRIREEARAAAGLSHPNIAQVYDFGESGEDEQRTPYVVMELVSGPTLEVRAAAGDLPPRLVFRICAEVAAALAAAHAEGLVHRDIKPANVILATAGAKVVDFGIAAAAGAADGGDPEGRVFGTPQYLAPERLTTDAVDPASDVYSLGVLLYKLLAGHSPWAATTPTEILDAHLYLEPEPLPASVDVPAGVVELYKRCLVKEPADRPAASEVALVLAEAAGVRTVGDDLAHSLAPRAADGGPSSVLVRRPRPAAAGPGGRRRRTGRIAVALLVVVALFAAGWVLIPVGHHEPAAQAERQQPGPAAAASCGSAPVVAGPTGPAANVTRGVVGKPQPSVSGTTPGATTAPAPGSQPTTGAPTPTPTQPVEPSGNPTIKVSQTFTSPGGSVVAECTAAGLAHLLSWTSTSPYKAKKIVEGPAVQASIRFKDPDTTSIIDVVVTCVDGLPTADITGS